MYLQICHLYILYFCQIAKEQEHFWAINHDLSPPMTVGRWTVAHNLKGENPSLFFWSKLSPSFAITYWICHKWTVMLEYTAQRVPGDLSRCRASHLLFHLIISIHFSGLTCICCIWNKTYGYEFLCCWFYYIGVRSYAPLFWTEPWVNLLFCCSGLVWSSRLLLFCWPLLMSI